MVSWPVALGPVERQFTTMGEHGTGNCSPCHGWERQEGGGVPISFLSDNVPAFFYYAPPSKDFTMSQ